MKEQYALCKGCGKKIMFVTTVDGATIPLDLKVQTWDYAGPGIYGRSTAFVSHFIVCPRANDFSGKNKKPTKQTELPL